MAALQGRGVSARRIVPIILCAALLGAGACSSGTSPDQKPTTARIQVTGTAPAPLRLVTSTDFYETIQDGAVVQVVRTADTTVIALPYDEVLPLSSLGSVVVSLTNPAPEPAQVELRVTLDSGQEPYRQAATLSLGGTLRYVFVFRRTRV